MGTVPVGTRGEDGTTDAKDATVEGDNGRDGFREGPGENREGLGGGNGRGLAVLCGLIPLVPLIPTLTDLGAPANHSEYG